MSVVGDSQRKHPSGQWKFCAHCRTRFVRRMNTSAPEWRRRIYCGVACGNLARHAAGVLFQKPIVPPSDWMDRAACVDSPYDFVPNTKTDAEPALRECRTADCPIRNACRDYAIRTRAYGVWGGEYFTYGEAKAA